jgi:hypothetical protein
MNDARKDAEIARQIEELNHMTVGQLQQRWVEVWNEPCRSRNKRFLQKRIAWRIQALAYGGLTERALQRAKELADETLLRIRPPRGFMANGAASRTVTATISPAPPALVPGTILTREYHRRLVVMVLDDGFEFEGRRYGSLTAIAKAVTGSHWNGRHFFGLTSKKS